MAGRNSQIALAVKLPEMADKRNVEPQPGLRGTVKPALAGHCRRVAALAGEIARHVRLPAEEIEALEQAALCHHAGTSAPSMSSISTEILEIANLFDERLEFLPFEPKTAEQILDEFNWMAQDGFFQPVLIAALSNLACIRKDEVLQKMRRLPVFPAVALKALAIAADENSNRRQMEALIARDQVLAGKLINAANSSTYSPLQRVATISQAVSYIGLEATRKVIITAAFEPLFASANLRLLWKHSLEMASASERLAELSGRGKPQEAFLAGLVHDVGRLALHILPRTEAAAYERLLEKGCEPVFAEMVLGGFDHGEVGADVLQLWTFPQHLVEAVAHHHRPERSATDMTALLYVAEFWTGSQEDLSSWVRLAWTLERIGLMLADLAASPARGRAVS